ncbi:hypothetical protein jhhlp_008529 [Lomentospora prolificans]|uniref:Calcineurin-like phosphoesterase domain-containing protein n=1 Tax=Lomentospora prolificans TaxID=41688 RepID=A0A2N3MYA6_9PEZI|nr:hypothetical protein jhhlp_008529 [Lomentospora prolificans]
MKPQPWLQRIARPPKDIALSSIVMLSAFSIWATVASLSRRWAPDLSHSHSALSLTRENTFSIAIFSDLHFGEEEHGWGIDQDINSTRVMNNILSYEEPDFVVINGDLITGENTFRQNSSAYVDQIVQPLLNTGTPWASTYGNHDSKFNLSRESIYRAERRHKLCYTHRMEPSLPGITNYYIPVYGDSRKAPAVILWFFDSRGGSSYQRSPSNDDDIPNWVADETAAWFTKSQKKLKKKYGRVIPSIAFVHIPPHVFLSAQASLDPRKFPGLNEDVPVAIQGKGTEDSAFVAALKATEGLHSIHVGHDHGDSWCSTWPEIDNVTRAPLLCFAKHTGYGGYGTWDRGARVLALSFKPGGDDGMTVESWVRMESGNKITHVSLNETYGRDEYES